MFFISCQNRHCLFKTSCSYKNIFYPNILILTYQLGVKGCCPFRYRIIKR